MSEKVLVDREQLERAASVIAWMSCRSDIKAADLKRLEQCASELSCALTVPAAQAEPVAWMWECCGIHLTANKELARSFVQDGFALTPLYAAPPAQHDAALVEAANAALKAIQDTLEDAYHNAFPECCGQAHLECCGSPIQAWDERDKKIMDRLGPHEKALRAALAGKGGE